MKYLKIGIYEFGAIVVISCAAVVRIVLIALGWPRTNSDEATMGIMAIHVAYQSKHPAIFYGQNYMGTIEAYIGSFLFHLTGGPSLFALRLGVVLLTMLFLVTMYMLTRLLYSRKLALLTLILLCVGSAPYLTRQTIATGGSSQTLLFGALAFLLASWLALTYRQGLPPQPLRKQWPRLFAYCVWGLAAGLGIWSDLVVLPFLFMSGLLLVLYCWREIRSLAPLCAIAFLLLGVSPFIYYNLSLMRPGSDSWTALLNLLHENAGGFAPTTLPGYAHAINQTILVSIPTATGSPYCPVLELSWLGDNTPPSLQCTLVQAAWGGGYLILWLIAFLITARVLWQILPRLRRREWLACWSFEEQQEYIRQSARLLLLLSAGLAIVLYAFSSAPVAWPGFHARYLIGLLIAAPAIVAPIASLIGALKVPGQRGTRAAALCGWFVLLLIEGSFVFGTVITFSKVPSAQASMRKELLIADYLISIGVKHMYTDYWTCDRIVFQSNERIVCDVVDDLMRSGYNRYDPYRVAVRGDPDSSYVFPLDTPVWHLAHYVAPGPAAHVSYLPDYDVLSDAPALHALAGHLHGAAALAGHARYA